MRNACLDAALAELDAVGIRDYQLVRGGKHLQLRWTVAGHTLRMRNSVAITPIEYGGLQEAYDHFNKELFSGELPDVFITYQRKARSLGYFSADRFNGRLESDRTV